MGGGAPVRIRAKGRCDWALAKIYGVGSAAAVPGPGTLRSGAALRREEQFRRRAPAVAGGGGRWSRFDRKRASIVRAGAIPGMAIDRRRSRGGLLQCDRISLAHHPRYFGGGGKPEMAGHLE